MTKGYIIKKSVVHDFVLLREVHGYTKGEIKRTFYKTSSDEFVRQTDLGCVTMTMSPKQECYQIVLCSVVKSI